MKTSDNRKQKYPRINLAFYGANLDYVREAAWQSRMSITEYINFLIDRDREQQYKAKMDRLVHLLETEDDEIIVINPDGSNIPIDPSAYYGADKSLTTPSKSNGERSPDSHSPKED